MNHFKHKTVNTLTILRIIGIPIVFLIHDVMIFFVYVNFLFATDFFDGFLARRWQMVSTRGAVLDLIADKLLVITLLAIGLFDQKISIILFLLIAFREISSMILRYTNYKKAHQLINASLIGKAKTAIQFIGLNAMILEFQIYHLLLWLVVILSYYSYLQYIQISKKGDQ